MKATETLKHEHRVIELVLGALREQADRVEAGQPLDRERAEKTLEVLRNFADRCHHGKEERLLFARLEQHGLPRESGPLAVMLHEHDSGRAHLRALANAIPGAIGGDERARREFVRQARAYVDLLTAHIGKEDHVLFRLADQTLSPEEDEQLARDFAALEREEIGEGVHEKYHEWAHELAGEAMPT